MGTAYSPVGRGWLAFEMEGEDVDGRGEGFIVGVTPFDIRNTNRMPRFFLVRVFGEEFANSDVCRAPESGTVAYFWTNWRVWFGIMSLVWGSRVDFRSG